MFDSVLKPRIDIPKHVALKLSIVGIISILTLWAAVTLTGLVGDLFLPTPLQTFTELTKLFAEKEILPDIVATVSRVFVGFAFSMLIAVPLGIFLGTFKKIEAFAEPLINLFRYIPAPAIVPLAILWFGIGEPQKYFIVFFGTFPYIVLYVTNAIASIEKKVLHAACSLGTKTKTLLLKVIFPKALPEIYEILRIELGAAWGLVILAEIIVSTTGLGHRLMLSQRFLQTSELFAEIILILLLAVLLDVLLKKGHKKFFPWAEKNRAVD